MNFKEIILHNYGGFNLKADIDEDPNDIIAAVLYSDHDDDFLVIKTAKGVYEYGLYVTRQGYNVECLSDDKCFEYQRSRFMKLPKLTGEFDYHGKLSEEIHFLLDEAFENIESFRLLQHIPLGIVCVPESGVRKYSSKDEAQWEFDSVCRRMKEYYEQSNVVYHYSTLGEYWIKHIKYFLEENEILTEENLKKLDDLRTYFRIDAIDGSAGKQEKRSTTVYGDYLKWVWYKGKTVTKKYHKHGIKVKGYTEYDGWGDYDRFSIDMDQFKETC